MFRVFRLNNGIYGQRQGGHNQMVRVKVPYGSIEPDQLEMLAHIGETYSRGWGHITTRQNVQFHFVQLEHVPRRAARPGVGRADDPGGVRRHRPQRHRLPPRRRLPFEVLDISPWAEAAFRHFLRTPLAQRLPRKFKINFSGCATDCGQAMFNDVGVIAVNRPRPTAPSSPASACSSPAASAPTRTRPRRSRSSRPRGPAAHDRGPSSAPSTTTATATTSCGPA